MGWDEIILKSNTGEMTPEKQEELLLDIHTKVAGLPGFIETQKAHDMRLGFVENRVAQLDTNMNHMEKDFDGLGKSHRGHVKDRSIHVHQADAPIPVESEFTRDARLAAKLLNWGLEHPTAAMFLLALLFTTFGAMLNKFIIFMHGVQPVPLPRIPGGP